MYPDDYRREVWLVGGTALILILISVWALMVFGTDLARIVSFP
jgi:hypothetical protein